MKNTPSLSYIKIKKIKIDAQIFFIIIVGSILVLYYPPS